jgi:hypothetical protein
MWTVSKKCGAGAYLNVQVSFFLFISLDVSDIYKVILKLQKIEYTHTHTHIYTYIPLRTAFMCNESCCIDKYSLWYPLVNFCLDKIIKIIQVKLSLCLIKYHVLNTYEGVEV